MSIYKPTYMPIYRPINHIAYVADRRAVVTLGVILQRNHISLDIRREILKQFIEYIHIAKMDVADIIVSGVFMIYPVRLVFTHQYDTEPCDVLVTKLTVAKISSNLKRVIAHMPRENLHKSYYINSPYVRIIFNYHTTYYADGLIMVMFCGESDIGGYGPYVATFI